MRAFLAVGLGQVVAAMGPGTMPAPAYDASSNGAPAAAPAPAPALLLFARCLKVWARAGGFFGKERHIPPAAGKQPHITFILMDD